MRQPEEAPITYEDVTFEELPQRATREVFLMTYSQADAQYTKEGISEIVVNAFQESGNAIVEKWVCAKEPHRNGGFHFHIALKLDRQKRWLRVKEYIERNHGILFHFSNKQKEAGETTLYDGAYSYVIKGGDFIVSEGHPEVLQAEEDKSNKLKNLDFMKLVVQMDLRTVLQVQAVANANAKAQQEGLLAFLASKSKARVAEIISLAWDIEEAPGKLKRLQSDRLQILRDCAELPCTCPEPNMWQQLASQVLALNNIGIDTYTQAVLAALTLGRGKFRNILHIGATNRAKSFLVQPLKVIFKAFQNPAHGTFNWVNVETAEVILLNDFRWARDVLPWEQMLLLLEGDAVRFPAPKNQFREDIEFEHDTPIFATSRGPVEYKSGSLDPAEVEMENAMMRSRWKPFHFSYEFTEAAQVTCKPCKHCYASFIFLVDVDVDALDDPIN